MTGGLDPVIYLGMVFSSISLNPPFYLHYSPVAYLHCWRSAEEYYYTRGKPQDLMTNRKRDSENPGGALDTVSRQVQRNSRRQR